MDNVKRGVIEYVECDYSGHGDYDGEQDREKGEVGKEGCLTRLYCFQQESREHSGLTRYGDFVI